MVPVRHSCDCPVPPLPPLTPPPSLPLATPIDRHQKSRRRRFLVYLRFGLGEQLKDDALGQAKMTGSLSS